MKRFSFVGCIAIAGGVVLLAAEVISAASPSMTALRFPSNGVPGSDIRIVWNGENMPARTAHTIIWSAKYKQQTGYYAWSWFDWGDDVWHGNAWELGRHPYPSAAGVVNAQGQVLDLTSSAGTVHFYEIAGLGANDFLCSPGCKDGGPFRVTKDRWITQATTAETRDGKLIYRYWPDLDQPAQFIEQIQTLAAFQEAGPVPPTARYYFGASGWTQVGSANKETPSGDFRNLMIFSGKALSIEDIRTEAASEDDSSATSEGRNYVWYINKNPTHTDVRDKSGKEHHPTWANSNRPRTVKL